MKNCKTPSSNEKGHFIHELNRPNIVREYGYSTTYFLMGKKFSEVQS